MMMKDNQRRVCPRQPNTNCKAEQKVVLCMEHILHNADWSYTCRHLEIAVDMCRFCWGTFRGISHYVTLLPCSEREYPPRFAQLGTLEYEAASRWKAYFEMEQAEKELLDQRMKAAKAQLEQEMVQLKEHHQAVLLRQGEPSYLREDLGYYPIH